MIENRYYAYGFEIILNQSRFTSEWLFELTSDNKEKLIFSRDIENGSYEFGESLKVKGLIDKLEVYAEDIQEDGSVLLLSMMNKNKKTLYQQYDFEVGLQFVYKWISFGVDVNYPNSPISDYSYMAKTENVEEICRIISAFGTGITGFKMVEVSPEKVLNNIPQNIKEDILSNIEKRVVRMKNNDNVQEIGIVMRSSKDFFILSVDK